ncbi:glycosyltransferase family 2 protein [Halobacterium rubrum]|uniref:glycosyltransferase family 2 protein n=1 Tax=Halobacterium TaxID=2239 RepID=UPI003016E781
MYRAHTVGVVVPAYNEAGFVGDTIGSVPGFVDRVYVVDDGSTDGTWQEIRAAARAENDHYESGVFPERVVPIQHDENRGVGGAIKTGYLRAREEDLDLVAVMGADGQMQPDALADLLDPVVDGRADYVKANRFLGRTSRGEMPRLRFVGNAMLGALTKIASGYWRTGDPQSGYTVISRRALDAVDIEEMYEFYGYCNDLLVKLNVAGMRVLDVPHPPVYGDEESHIRYRSYVPRVSAMLARNFLWRLKTKYLAFDFHPLAGAYAAGATASVAGLAGLAWAAPGVGSVATPLARFGAALAFLLVGALAFVAAMWMDMRANDHLGGTVMPNDPEPVARTDADTPAVSSDVEAPASRPVPDGTLEADGEGATVAVELAPGEWAALLDAAATDGGDPEDAAAARRLRERVRARLRDPERAAD